MFVSRNVTIIENDKIQAENLNIILKNSNFQCEVFHSAEEFLLSNKINQRCLYLIDLILPGIKAKEVTNLIRSRDKFSPIFILSGQQDEDKITEILKCDVDDYIQKPFNPEHLIIKLNNAHNRMNSILSSQLSIGIKLIPEADLVIRDGKALKLTCKEFKIMELLLKDKCKCHTREELIEHLDAGEITARTIDVHVSGLRKKLESINMEIETVRGIGYKVVVNEKN